MIERLLQAARQRVVLLVAPAGYGKSVALRQFLDTLDEPRIRFDVLPDHHTLLGFLRGLSEAIASVAPDARPTLPGAYEKNAASPSPGSDLALWMHSHLKSFRGVIAIDDLHVAQEDREVPRFLASLIERTKGRVQWIIASRSTAGLPIGTWLAYGESDLAVDEHDLKFSIEEAREAARAFRLAVRDDELYELLNITDGWATAVTFALRSSTRSVDLRNISSMTREMIYRYLAEQVYSSLAENERAFVETCALLPEIDVDLLTASGFDRAAALLEEMRARVAFITEREPGRYRLHDLFREFALHALELRGAREAAEIRLRFAALLIDAGREVEAMRLYAEAKALDRLMDVLERHGMTMVSRGYIDEVHAALAHFSASQEPVVVALRGLVLVANGKTAEGERLLERAIPNLESADIAADLTMRLGVLAANRGEDVDDLLLPVSSDERLDDNRRLEARALLAATAAVRGQADAEEMIRSVQSAARFVDSDASLVKIASRLGFAYTRIRRYQEARECLKQTIEIGANCGLWGAVSRAYTNLAQIALYVENAPSVALWNAQQAANASTRAGDQNDLQAALLTILSIETRRGNADRALQVERQIGELTFGDAARARFIASSQAHRYAWSERFSDAQRLFGSILDRQPYIADRIAVHAFYTLTLALEGSRKQSAEAAERAVAILRSESDGSSRFGATLEECSLWLIALAEVLNGRLAVAARLLKRQARSEHELSRCMRAAVEDLLRMAKTPAYVSDELDGALEAIDGAGWGGYGRYLRLARVRIEQSFAPEKEHEISLTPSELRILRYLAAGLSPKEVAAEMGRSPLTVQTHIQNLAHKLGSHGRTDTIATARRLGFLGSGNGST